MIRELWELPDAEIWALVDGARHATWLRRQFEHSEREERRERHQVAHATPHGMPLTAFAAFASVYADFTPHLQALVDDMERLRVTAIGLTVAELLQLEQELAPAPPPAPRRSRSGPARHTLKAALHTPAPRAGRATLAAIRQHRTQRR